MDIETNDNSLFESLHTPLFRVSGVSTDHVTAKQPPLRYAVTLHPHRMKKLNNKCYGTYTHDQQRALLTRLEAAMRRDNPSIKLIEIHFETAPKIGTIHYHALYEMPDIFVTTMENYLNHRTADKKPKGNIEPWRNLDIQPIYHESGWIDYIRKDATK